MKIWLMKSEPDECSIDDALAAPRSANLFSVEETTTLA